MSIDLKKNGSSLKAAYEDVLNKSSDTDWAVFGYEGNTNVLKTVETGDGGLDEMADEMNGGKCLYAFLRVTDPNTQLPKNVLINWQGEGVPTTHKGVCARHTRDVADFFRGAHVTVNARSEMDLEEDSILDKVAKASGANFSFHKEKAKPLPEQGSVGSVYQKANPRADIDARSRDQFWARQEQDEEQRKVTERRAAAEERKELELQRRQREAEQGRARERAAEERGRSLEEQRRQEKQRQTQELQAKEDNLQQRLKQEESAVEAERRRERDESQRQRVQEYKAVSSAVSSKKAGFEQPAEEPPSLPQRPSKRAVPEPPPELEPEPEPEEQEWEPEPEPEPEPEQPTYDDVHTEPQEPEQPLYDDVNQDYAQEPAEQEEEAVPSEPAAPEREGGEGLTAVTIYDYQAEDEGELTFDEDERITNIEQIDDGWWRGVRELDGSHGIFPANYVQLV